MKVQFIRVYVTLILYLFLENLIFICSKYKPIKKTSAIKFDKKINTIKIDRASKSRVVCLFI